MSIKTCGHAGYCVMCEVDAVNIPPRDIEPREGPTAIECGIVGLGVAFSAWSAIAVFGAIAALVVRYDAVTGSLIISLIGGFLAGVWLRLRR